MSILAQCDAADLDAHLPLAGLPTDAIWLRRPEFGLVMVRGRAGGTGAAFNLGEMSVTRCAVRLDGDTVGLAYLRGRNALHAQRAALIDGLLQQAVGAGRGDDAWSVWIAPLEAVLQARRNQRKAAADQTRVEFFTVVRGEDD
jgi:alpha-D-ribose 1-methylphosphonate 5-triphosphate synthase subunit PhnG